VIKQSMNISLGLCKIVELADEKNKTDWRRIRE